MEIQFMSSHKDSSSVWAVIAVEAINLMRVICVH